MDLGGQAGRALTRAPWYSATIVGVIAICVALSATVFAVVDGVLFKPLPYARPGELYLMLGSIASRSGGLGWSIAPRNARDWTAAIPGASTTLLETGFAASVVGDIRGWAPVTANVDERFFDVLGIAPLLGGFQADDFVPSSSSPRAAMISYRVWQDRFDGRPDILGQSITMDNKPGTFRIAGVTAPDFVFPSIGEAPSVLIAARVDPSRANDLTARGYTGLTRIPAGMALAEARARAQAAAHAEAADWAPTADDARAFDDVSLQPLQRTVKMFNEMVTYGPSMIATLVLVLLGCVNISSLMAARGHARRQEQRVRRALGASTAAIVRLILLENTWLIGAGAIVGLALAAPLLRALVRLLPASVNLLKAPGIDWRVAVFSIGVMAASVMLTSFWPIATSGTAGTAAGPSAGERTTHVSALSRRIAVALQVAFAVPIMLAGALVVGSMIQVARADAGFDAAHTILLQGSTSSGTAAARRQAVARAEDRLRSIPGVSSVGSSDTFLGARGSFGVFKRAASVAIQPGFLAAIQPTLEAGRLVTEAEVARGDSVALVSTQAAAQFFPGSAAVGQPLVGVIDAQPRTFTVVGVIKGLRTTSLDDDATAQVFAPDAALAGEARDAGERRTVLIALRTSNAPATLPAVIDAARAMAPDVTVRSASVGGDFLNGTIRMRQLTSWAFGTFALSALLVVAVGVAGLVAMTTARRTREVGIRMALGATPRGILRMIVREQVLATIIGLVLGGLLAWWSAALVRTMLYHVAPTDPRVWLAGLATTAAAALAAAAIPARTASRLDPARALRTDGN